MVELDHIKRTTVFNSLKNYYIEEYEKLRDINNKVTPDIAQNVNSNLHNLIVPVNTDEDPETFIKEWGLAEDTYTESRSKDFTNSLNSVSFGPMALEDALPILLDEAEEDTFYGVIAVDNESNKTNIFHPMVAMYLVKNWESYKDKVFTYYVFQSDRLIRDTGAIEFYKDRLASLLFFKPVETYTQEEIWSSSSQVIDNTVVSSRMGNDKLPQLYITSLGTTVYNVGTPQQSDNTFVFVPQQILNTGIAFPYYGFSAVKTNGDNAKAFNLCPMLSANIGDYMNNDDNDLSQTNVCTGRLKKHTLEGIRSLNHSNLESPLNSDVLLTGWEQLVNASIETSVELLSSLVDIKTILTEEDFKTKEAWNLYLKMMGE